MPAITQAPVSSVASLSANLISTNPSTSSVATFDPHDENSWFFGFMSRADATDLLLSHNEVGAFLVRESTTAKGDLVLSVRENKIDKISHYIINRLSAENGNQLRFKIGDHIFTDIPALLTFYKSNNLDDTPLKCTAVPKSNSLSHPRRSFSKDYLGEVCGDSKLTKSSNGEILSQELKLLPTFQRRLPGKAVVIQSRIPNAYDKTALALKEGQIINVTKVDISGCWEGEVDGRTGHFPFNYVKFIEDSSDSHRETL